MFWFPSGLGRVNYSFPRGVIPLGWAGPGCVVSVRDVSHGVLNKWLWLEATEAHFFGDDCGCGSVAVESSGWRGKTFW